MKNEQIDEVQETGVVIIGSGLAGMVTALKLSPLPVVLVTKSEVSIGSSSYLAQGGVAAAVGDNDSSDLHKADTESVGMGLTDSHVAGIITSAAPREIEWLSEIGVEFDRVEGGDFSLGKEGAHSRRRILHAHGDKTGYEMVKALREAVLASSHIKVMENHFAADLVKEKGRISGVVLRKDTGEWILLKSRCTVLATGGIGAVYGQTTNPVEATGDGLAMAYRAGVRLADMEFVQFHPTALLSSHNPLPLLTEALRGEGAVLIDDKGRRFMQDIHPLMELAPRDVVSRAIWERRRQNIPVFLDCTLIWNEDFPVRFPTVMSNCRQAGLDPSSDPLPVVTAAHYHIGGILTDADGKSSLPGLWACGEAAATMVHGANRLASNSLLEALVVGSRVAGTIRETCRGKESAGLAAAEIKVKACQDVPGIRREASRIMWDKVGLLRSAQSLEEALAGLGKLEEALGEGFCEEKNMVTVGRLIALSAFYRQESRGVHFRTDFPETDSRWNKHICLQDRIVGTIRTVNDPMEVLIR